MEKLRLTTEQIVTMPVTDLVAVVSEINRHRRYVEMMREQRMYDCKRVTLNYLNRKRQKL